MDWNKLGIQLQAFGEGVGGRGQQFIEGLNAQRKEAMAKDAYQVETMLSGGDVGGARELLLNRVENIERLGGDPSDTLGLINRIDSGDLEGALNDAMTVTQGARQAGYLPNLVNKIENGQMISYDPLSGKATVSPVEGYKQKPSEPKWNEDIGKYTRYNSQTGQIEYIDAPEGTMTKAERDRNNEFLKEERGYLSGQVKDINKRTSEVLTLNDKVKNLTEQVAKGGAIGRAALGATVMSIARMVSPGVVTDADARALSGTVDPIAMLIDRVRGREGSESLIDALQKAYDPTNPNLVKPEQLLSLANSIVSAEVPSLLSSWDDLQSRAVRSGVSETARNTYFGDNKGIERLRNLGVASSATPTGETATNPQTGQKIQKMSDGTWRPM